MKFFKYPSITNSYQKKFIERIVYSGKNSGEWICCEKVHGANASFTCDEENVVPAKRTSFLGTDSNFFGVNSIYTKYKDDMLRVFRVVQDELGERVNQIQICGEIFGGHYPHPDVPKDPQASRVQKGVGYIPNNDFISFDLRVITDSHSFFVSDDAMRKYYKKAQVSFKSVPIIFRGSFEECLKQSDEFQTKIPEMYGLPPIEDNICEGIVIKPNDVEYDGHSRIVLKKKNEKFSERKASPRTARQPVVISEEAKNAMNLASQYINENRLNNVLSKYGTPEKMSEIGKVLKLFVSDVFEDFTEDNPQLYNSFQKSEQKGFNKFVSHESVKLIKEWFNENV